MLDGLIKASYLEQFSIKYVISSVTLPVGAVINLDSHFCSDTDNHSKCFLLSVADSYYTSPWREVIQISKNLGNIFLSIYIKAVIKIQN